MINSASSAPSRTAARVLALALLVAAVWGGVSACSDHKERTLAKSDGPIVVRDIPEPLRGTVQAEATLRGIDPVLVSGIGLVVGLDGTGGGPYPAAVQGTMERMLGLQGMGKGTLNDGGPFAGWTPQQVLASKDVSVVVVEAVVAPGAPKGSSFDVRVSGFPGTSTTSLENGKLWTTELRFGPPAAFGAQASRVIGRAKGSVFINPFAESVPGPDALSPGAGNTAALPASDGVVRTVGRVLGGGEVTEPLSLELVLDNSSHARAMAIKDAINSAFPPNGGAPTAHGRSGQSIAVRVPDRYRERPADFVNTLMALRVDQQFKAEYAKRYVDELEKSPGLSDRLQWCIEALGEPAVPFLSRLYDYPELLPQMTALRAGARMGDPRAGAYLVRVAADARQPVPLRAEAAELAGFLGSDPSVDLALRELVNTEDLEVRAAAYQAMVNRGDPYVARLNMGGKFTLDLVPSTRPLIYVTQQGKPKIVLFGEAIALARPMLLSAWDDRLLMTAGLESEGAPSGADANVVRVQYRDPRSPPGAPPVQTACAPDLVSVIRLFSRSPSRDDPDPGLGMSYSQVVGALYQLQRQGAVRADFATERDRLGDRVLEAQQAVRAEDRPESDKKRAEMKDRAKLLNPVANAKKQTVNPEAAKSWVVPIPPKAPKEK
ncbi:MAG: flagellar basal body P-ring protein FlgI [Phycisphaerales bacterium]|nr:flagellar basal body P-ring protein FlgI [Phycisphaerales bacterium]